MSRRIGFVRMGPHPIPNRLLPGALEKRFPGYTLEVLDIEPLVRGRRRLVAAGAARALGAYGPLLARRRLRPWPAFFGTAYMFEQMSKLARAWVRQGDFAFTFQIQSLFDASVPGTPHFVYTDHTHLANIHYPDYDRRLLRGERWLALEGALYHGSDAVFTRSENISASLREQYDSPPTKEVCARAGSNAHISRRPSDPERGLHILFVGVDWERKGGPELVRAFEALHEQHPEATLTVVGCSPALSHPAIRVLGRVPVDRVHEHYAEATVFCMPTRREPFGVVFVEALHHGLPIVATNLGALPDLVRVGHNGYLVDPGDTAGMAAALAALGSDAGLRRRMGQASLEHARRHYTWESVTAVMADTIGPTLMTSSETND